MIASLPLLRQLQASAQRDHAPFYAPGHKQGRGASFALQQLLGTALQADLPELPELDNLFAPAGAIAAAQAFAAETFGAERTWFLVNGSSCGLMAAIAATCGEDEKLILPRNCHQSAISGLILSGARPIFVQPTYDAERDLTHGVTPEAIAAALKIHPDAKAVLVVSPTYHGVCSDLGAITQLVHNHGLPLIVDEAHGAHFAFHPDLPPTALSLGADIAVQSTHKTLGAMTQAAMLHLQGDRVDPQRISLALQWVQSTSPNYLLLASLDAATAQMAEEGEALMNRTLAIAQRARDELAQFAGVDLLKPTQSPQPGFATLDPTRLTVFTPGLGRDGFSLDEQLHESLGVTAELPLERHLTFIISLGNTGEDIEHLVRGWQILSQERQEDSDSRPAITPLSLPSAPLTPRQASFSPTRTVPFAASEGEISGAIVCPYPPGIPILMPGEQISGEAIAALQQIETLGGYITGLGEDNTIQVVTSPSR